MTLDGLSLRLIVNELGALKDSKIEKIYQPAKDDITLLLHTKNGKKRLLISASGGDCRLNLSEAQTKNPDKAPNFCMLLRKYIMGGRIEGVEQVGFERVASIVISARDEIGVVSEYRLIAEIMGKYSNIILTRNGVILDSIHRVPPDMSSVRQVLPGMKYTLFPMDKLDPVCADTEMIAEKISSGRIMPFVAGVSDMTEKEIFLRTLGREKPGMLSEAEALAAANGLKKFFEDALSSPNPAVQSRNGKPYFYSPLPFFTQSEEGRKYYPTMNEAVDAFFTVRGNAHALEMKKNVLKRVLKRSITKAAKKLSIQTDALNSKEKSEKLRLFGELLSANIYMIKRGADKACVLNYYTNENIEIPLDPALSPSANVDAYFKKSSKLKTAAAMAKTRCEELSKELEYLEELDYELDKAKTLADAEEVRLDLIRFGYLEQTDKKKILRTDPLESPMQFVTSDGFTVLAGRNNRQNDALTFHAAGAEDMWFHVKGAPGSHVILFLKGKEPTDTAIEQAAAIAAKNSSVKGAKCEVDYTRVKYIWKANGAKPGMVLFKNQKTVIANGEDAPPEVNI